MEQAVFECGPGHVGNHTANYFFWAILVLVTHAVAGMNNVATCAIVS